MFRFCVVTLSPVRLASKASGRTITAILLAIAGAPATLVSIVAALLVHLFLGDAFLCLATLSVNFMVTLY